MTKRDLATETQQSAIYWIRCLTELYPGGVDEWHPLNDAVTRLSAWLRADAKGQATVREWAEVMVFAQNVITEYSGIWFDLMDARRGRAQGDALREQLREWYQAGYVELTAGAWELTARGRKALVQRGAA